MSVVPIERSGGVAPYGMAAALLTALALSPRAAFAQTLVGRVLEDGTGTPISGAMVSLVDGDGEERASYLADSVGRFRVAPPEAGNYQVRVIRLGYETTESPLFALQTEGQVEIELMMTAKPIGLEGFEISVEGQAVEQLRTFGVTPAQLHNRWIDRADIEKMGQPGLPKDIIRWQNVAGVTVDEYDSGAGGSLCVRFQRSNLQCAITVLDGMVIPPEQAFVINGDDIEAIAILDPNDATTFYGTQGGGGAVLIWTRQGRR